MTLNTDLLDKTLHHIETLVAFQREGIDLDDRWDQGWWATEIVDENHNVCGTAACFAGWACHLAGDTLVSNEADPRSIAPDGTNRGVMDRAVSLLGLNHLQGCRLFRASNTLDDLRTLVAALKAGDNLEDHHVAG